MFAFVPPPASLYVWGDCCVIAGYSNTKYVYYYCNAAHYQSGNSVVINVYTLNRTITLINLLMRVVYWSTGQTAPISDLVYRDSRHTDDMYCVWNFLCSLINQYTYYYNMVMVACYIVWVFYTKMISDVFIQPLKFM